MEPLPITINGYDTYYSIAEDRIGHYLLIVIPPNAGKDISDICGTVVENHLIKQIDYATSKDIRFIKAYY